MSSDSWRRAAARAVAAEPLFAGACTERGLDAPGRRPRAVYLGIGLCTRHRMAVGLPVDVLGMVLPAERLRSAIGAERLIVLVADAHALSNGFAPAVVEARAKAVARALLRLRAKLGLHALVLVRASALHREAGYLETLARIRSVAAGEGNEYVYRQTADVAFLEEALGGILKLGWTVGGQGGAGGYRDEVAFDRLVSPWSGRHPRFAYVVCGRALDDRRPKVSPYVGVDRGRRIYLDPREAVGAKLARARQLASKRNAAAFREHLGRIADAFGAEGASLEARLQAILRGLYPGMRTAPVPRPQSDSRGSIAGDLALEGVEP